MEQNGFVVVDHLWRGEREVMDFGRTLYNLYSEDKNLLVTTDMMIHAWHMSFDSILMVRCLTFNPLHQNDINIYLIFRISKSMHWWKP